MSEQEVEHITDLLFLSSYEYHSVTTTSSITINNSLEMEVNFKK